FVCVLGDVGAYRVTLDGQACFERRTHSGAQDFQLNLVDDRSIIERNLDKPGIDAAVPDAVDNLPRPHLGQVLLADIVNIGREEWFLIQSGIGPEMNARSLRQLTENIRIPS